jgi:HK97 family phage portal protein
MWWKRNSLSCFEKPKALLKNSNNSLFYDFYKTNPVVYRAVLIYSRHICSFNVLNKEKITTNWIEFIHNIIHRLLITGNAILDKDLNFYDDQMIILKNETNKIIGYKIQNHLFNSEEIIHLKMFGSSMGISPMESAKKSIEAHEEITNFIIALIQNGGRPSGILSHDEFYGAERIKLLKQEMMNMYNGINKVGSMAFLEGKYKWEQIGISPEKLNLIEHKQKFEMEIALAFDIPPIILGLQQGIYSNYKEAREQFVYFTVKPLLEYVLEVLNSSFNFQLKIIEENNSTSLIQ